MNNLKKVFEIIGSIKSLVMLLNITIVAMFTMVLIKNDLFYIILQTYVQNNFKDSTYLVKYIENSRIANFYGRKEFDEKIKSLNDNYTDKYWSYNLIENRKIYSELKLKINNKNDFIKMVEFFNDLDNFYFDLINSKYKYNKEAAFYKLKEILEKYRCEIYNIVSKYGLDWSKTIVSPVNGLVYESLYNTQTVNDEMRNGMNKIFIINGYGQYFLQILMPDKCSEIRISN